MQDDMHMPMINTDITLFKFVHSGLPADTFSVEALQGIDRIGIPYSFEVLLHSVNHSIALGDIVMKNATVFLDRLGESYYPYSGVVTSFEYIDSSVDYSVYRAILQPQLWKLTLSRNNRVFLKKSIPAVVAEILDERGFDKYYEWRLDNTYPEREYIVQYDETDYNFICRHCEALGIRLLFEEPAVENGLDCDVGEERLILTDNQSSYRPLPFNGTILFRSRTDMVQSSEDDNPLEAIHELNLCRQIVPAIVTVKNHNYRTPETDLSHTVKVKNGDRGLMYRYGGSFETTIEAQTSAKILSDRLSCNQLFFEGKSDCRGLRAGNIICIEEHPRSDCNGEVLITEVRHSITSRKDRKESNALPYTNSFKSIPVDQAARFQPEEQGSSVHIPGVTSTLVESNDSEYAYLDEMGRYKLRLQFDRSNSANCNGSNFIRQAQAYSGSGIGVHLPSHEKTELLLGHVLGNPDRPVGLGTVPNADTVSPVTSDNHRQSIIRTAGENEIIMDDTDGKKKFFMTAPYDQSFSAQGNKAVSVGGDRTISVKKNESGAVDIDQKVTVNGDQSITVNGDDEVTLKNTHDHTIEGNQSVKVTGSRKLEITLAGKEAVGGGRTVEIGGNSSLSLKTAGAISIQGTGSFNADGSMGMESATVLTLSAAGKVSIEGKNVTMQSIATVTVVCGGSSMVISPAGIVITSSKLKVAGKEVNSVAGTANTLLAGIIKIN